MLAVLGCPLTAQNAETDVHPAANEQRWVQQGIDIRLRMERLATSSDPPTPLQEGEDVRFRFHFTDTTSRLPLTGAYPAAWMTLRPEKEIPGSENCVRKAESLLSGSLFSQAELDLNVYYVMTLNEDATITVVDPLFGFGSTKLLALIQLPGVGHDWALSADQSRLFVSMPEKNQLAVIDTHAWEMKRTLPAGPRPGRLLAQPDGHYLWIAYDGQGEDSGVGVLDVQREEIVAHLRTGPGPHDLEFSADSRFAFVANAGQGAVSVIDVSQLKKLVDVQTGPRPVALAYSKLADAVYVSDEKDGTITTIDAKRHEAVAKMKADAGLGQIKFAPGGRFGFVVNPASDELYILDATSNRIIQNTAMLDQPDQVAFSDELAYVRHRGDETVLMIPLDDVGVEARNIQVVDFPGGDNPPGRMSQPTPASGIVQAPGANAVLVSNPGDRSVYFYKEGMAAPMGNFSNYGRSPKAVMVLDKSLRPRTEPGVYETVARLRSPGFYDLVLFLDAPRIVHCFEVRVAPNPELERKRLAERKTEVHPVRPSEARAGEETQVRFQLIDPRTGEPVTGVEDVEIMVYLSPGVWHTRGTAAAVGPGVYGLRFTPPQAGAYFVYLRSPSLRIGFEDADYLKLPVGPSR